MRFDFVQVCVGIKGGCVYLGFKAVLYAIEELKTPFKEYSKE